MGEGTKKTAHFTITGAALTSLVRARMLDDAPGAAFRLAGSLISDDPLEQHRVPSLAIRLCNGTAKMIGNESDMRLVDDNSVSARRYRQALAWFHAGRIRVGTKWYQPIAYVEDVGREDVGDSPREKHYCGTDEIVLEQAEFPDPKFLSIKRGVIFQLCGERPHWHEVPRGPQEALEEFLAAGRCLEPRGNSRSYPTREPQSKRFARGPNTYAGTEKIEDREAREDAEHAAAEAARLARVAELRVTILAQAGDDLIELRWPDGMTKYDDPPKVHIAAGSAMVPRAPFVIWAFAKLSYLKMQMPEWKTISPSGMKMPLDDSNHTDWVIGAGFDPHDRELYYGGAYGTAAEELRSRLQDEHDDRRRAAEEAVTTLVAGPTVTGVVVHGRRNKASPPGSIVVLPDLRPAWLLAVRDAAAVITQEGGEVAHLAQVGRERGLPIVRRPDALEQFREGDTVEVNSEARTARGVRRHVADLTEVEEDDDDC